VRSRLPFGPLAFELANSPSPCTKLTRGPSGEIEQPSQQRAADRRNFFFYAPEKKVPTFAFNNLNAKFGLDMAS
jgi:hypothetical protein